MSFIAFAVFCLVLLLAAFTIVRARRRRFNCREMVEHVKPLSEQAQAKRLPETLDEFIAMYKAANNLTWLTMIADRYQRSMAACTDAYSVENMRLVHATFLRKRVTLIKSLLCGVMHLCAGRIGKRHSSLYLKTIQRHYGDVLLLAQEMAELMDPRCAGILEGHLLHGS